MTPVGVADESKPFALNFLLKGFKALSDEEGQLFFNALFRITKAVVLDSSESSLPEHVSKSRA
jgi:hypothetical protein